MPEYMLKCSDFDQIGVQKLRKIDHNRSEIDETCDFVVNGRPKTPRGTQEAVQEGPRRPKWPPMEAKPCPKPSQNKAEFVQK